MSIIDFPIGRCEAVREMVLLDATQHECACEHGCPPDFDCPLVAYFSEVSGLSDETAAALKLSGLGAETFAALKLGGPGDGTAVAVKLGGKCLKQPRPAVPA